jgi:hypothetical protein
MNLTRRAPVLAAVLVGLAWLAAGCGGGSKAPSVVSLATTTVTGTSADTSGSSTDSASTTGSLVAYAGCMRSHGVPNFPDPKPGGGFDLTGTGINRFSPQVESAQKACASVAPAGLQKTPAQVQHHTKVMMAVAKCMRANGVPYFPDPNSQGSIITSSSEWDPSSPQFQAAAKVCNHLNPGTG